MTPAEALVADDPLLELLIGQVVQCDRVCPAPPLT